jgi:phenylalanine-4-hydroxylase
MIKPSKSPSTLTLEKQYEFVRKMRENEVSDNNKLKQIFELLQKEYPQDWLLPMEILETTDDKVLKQSLLTYLNELMMKYPKYKTLIREGIKMVDI